MELSLGRIRRILRKLLGKLGDLEEDVTLHPSAYQPEKRRGEQYSSNSGRKRVSDGLIPPAHPFEHLVKQQHSFHQKIHIQPRYTYKRRRFSDIESSVDSSEEDEFSIQPVGHRKRQKKRHLPRSANLGSLSDSGMASSDQDPTQWLTTPRKRTKRRSLISGADTGRPIRYTSASTSANTNSSRDVVQESFDARLDSLVALPAVTQAKSHKSKFLLTHMIHLGEMLWLGNGTTIDSLDMDREEVEEGAANLGAHMRVLPLKVISAFRMGEALAYENDNNDLDYLDELYGSISPFLARFVLWQHAVTLCFQHVPAYADTLSEALWEVGAFYQQGWLIDARLSYQASQGGLVKSENVAPLHLRAIDIGGEDQFITNMLHHLSDKPFRFSHISSIGIQVEGSLWYQFIPPDSISKRLAANYADSDEHHGNHFNGLRGFRYRYFLRKQQQDLYLTSGEIDKATPSRYTKWVARISDTRQSIRILAAALIDVLSFITTVITVQPQRYVPNISPTRSENGGGAYIGAALLAAKTICSVMSTKLNVPAKYLSGLSDGIVDKLLKCSRLLGRLAKPTTDNIADDIEEICGLCQIVLMLLTLRLLNRNRTSANHQQGISNELTAMAKSLLQRVCSSRPMAQNLGMKGVNEGYVDCHDNASVVPSRRQLIVAQFNRMIKESSNNGGDNCHQQNQRQKEPDELEARVWDAIVLPLAMGGGSPMLFAEIVQIVANDLGNASISLTIANSVLERFDPIWNHYNECRILQEEWGQLPLEVAADTIPSKANESSPPKGLEDARLKEMARLEFKTVTREIEQKLRKSKQAKQQQNHKRATQVVDGKVKKKKKKKMRRSNDGVAADELGLFMMSRSGGRLSQAKTGY